MQFVNLGGEAGEPTNHNLDLVLIMVAWRGSPKAQVHGPRAVQFTGLVLSEESAFEDK